MGKLKLIIIGNFARALTCPMNILQFHSYNCEGEYFYFIFNCKRRENESRVIKKFNKINTIMLIYVYKIEKKHLYARGFERNALSILLFHA